MRPRVRLYATAAQKTVAERGFTDLKFNPLPDPRRLYPDHREMKRAGQAIRRRLAKSEGR